MERTLDLLVTKYLKAGISYQGVQRVETLPVTEAALREAVLNAIVHKDYASGTPIQISVYNNKLMVWNPGELPPHWTMAKLRGKHPSRPFNPDIANAFFRAGLIEAWGRGIERIIAARKAKAIEYEEYLKRVAELARRVDAGHADDTPEQLRTNPALRAVYHNLKAGAPGETRYVAERPLGAADSVLELAGRIDETVRRVRPDGWRGVQAREYTIKAALLPLLGNEAEVERMFLIIKAQRDY